jgi:hypothetical protein
MFGRSEQQRTPATTLFAQIRTRRRVLRAEALSIYESIGMPDHAQRTSARLAANAV